MSLLLFHAGPASAQHPLFPEKCPETISEERVNACFWMDDYKTLEMVIAIEKVSGWNGEIEYLVLNQFPEKISMDSLASSFDGLGRDIRKVAHPLDALKGKKLQELIPRELLDKSIAHSEKFDVFGNERNSVDKSECWDGLYSTVYYYTPNAKYVFEMHSCDDAAPYGEIFERVLVLVEQADPKSVKLFKN